MLTNIIIVASALAQAYAPPSSARPAAQAVRAAPAIRAPVATAAIPGRTLKDLPGATVTYFDVPGKTGPAIDKSLKRMLDDPTAKDAVRMFSWDVDMQITKITKGTTCTVQNAKSTLTVKVRLPRLAEQAKVRKDVLANWTTYVTNVENESAANLWFLSDRLRGAAQTVVGIPCDQARPAWNAKLDTVKAELNALVAQRAAPVPKPATKS